MMSAFNADAAGMAEPVDAGTDAVTLGLTSAVASNAPLNTSCCRQA